MITIERGDVWISCRTTAWGEHVMEPVPDVIRVGMPVRVKGDWTTKDERVFM